MDQKNQIIMKKYAHNGHYTLVTGASAGIGKALAEECARRGRNLFLVALPGTGLPEFSDHLRSTYGIKTEYTCIDLTLPESPEKIYSYSVNRDIPVDFLINNAGIGYAGSLEDHTQEEIDEMITLNIRVLTSMTRLFMPELKKCPKAYILNVGSFGGFLPAPFKSVYLASKSYVFYFSEALRRELHGGPVKVATMMPGPVYTNNEVRKRIMDNGFGGRVTAMEPEEVAKYALRKVFSRGCVIIPGNVNQSLHFSLGLLPWFVLVRMMRKLFEGKA